jgi:hypothetical protein
MIFNQSLSYYRQRSSPIVAGVTVQQGRAPGSAESGDPPQHDHSRRIVHDGVEQQPVVTEGDAPLIGAPVVHGVGGGLAAIVASACQRARAVSTPDRSRSSEAWASAVRSSASK